MRRAKGPQEGGTWGSGGKGASTGHRALLPGGEHTPVCWAQEAEGAKGRAGGTGTEATVSFRRQDLEGQPMFSM